MIFPKMRYMLSKPVRNGYQYINLYDRKLNRTLLTVPTPYLVWLNLKYEFGLTN